jgi:hypothetical protein
MRNTFLIFLLGHNIWRETLFKEVSTFVKYFSQFWETKGVALLRFQIAFNLYGRISATLPNLLEIWEF